MDLKDFENFREIIAKLRAPGGCPWDQKQTHNTLKPYLIEEVYEVLECINEGNRDKLCEELGDLLLQILLHAQIASEERAFDISDVIQKISKKIIHRHPHVFGKVKVSGAKEVSAQWQRLKKEDKEISILDGLPKSMPALVRCQALQHRAANVGFDWKEIDGILEKINEELEELREAKGQRQRVQEFGDVIFALANVARWLDVDLEEALRLANDRFYKRFSHMEEVCRKKGIPIHKLSLEELDALWEEAKEELSEN